MSTRKIKRQGHPKLAIPFHRKTWTPLLGYVKGDYVPGDEGKIINGRCYSYHPTKGWRSRAA